MNETREPSSEELYLCQLSILTDSEILTMEAKKQLVISAANPFIKLHTLSNGEVKILHAYPLEVIDSIAGFDSEIRRRAKQIIDLSGLDFKYFSGVYPFEPPKVLE